jgi:2-oxoglutarate dehydrogenase E2 component (dihydrolipoamide succinyltransferase)
MVSSKATSPHVAMAVEVDFSAVDQARRWWDAQLRAREGFGLSYLPFIAFGLCRAVEAFPYVNAQIDEGRLRVHHAVHLGIAVDLEFHGLVVPVVRNASEQSVAGLAREIRRLSSGARARKLSPDDVQGGTYTISNPGPNGTFFTTPIINQPQVAILSTDGVRKRAVVIDEGGVDSIVARPTGLLIQSFDHRAFDGAYSAAFLDRLRTILEMTAWVGVAKEERRVL